MYYYHVFALITLVLYYSIPLIETNKPYTPHTAYTQVYLMSNGSYVNNSASGRITTNDDLIEQICIKNKEYSYLGKQRYYVRVGIQDYYPIKYTSINRNLAIVGVYILFFVIVEVFLILALYTSFRTTLFGALAPFSKVSAIVSAGAIVVCLIIRLVVTQIDLSSLTYTSLEYNVQGYACVENTKSRKIECQRGLIFDNVADMGYLLDKPNLEFDLFYVFDVCSVRPAHGGLSDYTLITPGIAFIVSAFFAFTNWQCRFWRREGAYDELK